MRLQFDARVPVFANYDAAAPPLRASFDRIIDDMEGGTDV
jgi:hypothetical protein